VPPPSGEQFEIVFDAQRAVVVQVGGGLRTYAAGGRDVLDGYGEDQMCSSGRGQVLIPWPNRIAGGNYEFGGRQHQLPIDEPARNDAIHGLVRWSEWRPTEREAHRVVVEHQLDPQPGYPFSLALRIEYVLSGHGLRVTTTATNVGAEPCPYGAGAHPYLFPGPRVDGALLRLPALRVLEADHNGLPTGSAPVEGSGLDFREQRPVRETKLDHCFTDLARDGDGLVRVTLTRPELDATVTLWADESYPYLMLYTGDDRPDVSRHSLAVEPMTCPPNAFRSGEGVIVLEPGGTATGTWGLTASY
jgi:aldose 1-epimerase